MAAHAAESALSDDVEAQVLARSVLARVAAARGAAEEALALAEEAVAIAAATDGLVTHGDALTELGVVLAQLDRPADAEARLAEARGLYRSKGARLLESKAQLLLDGLRLGAQRASL